MADDKKISELTDATLPLSGNEYVPVVQNNDNRKVRASTLQGQQGPSGPQGAQGAKGDPGPGIAGGGVAGDVLTKVDNTDFNTQWTAQSAVIPTTIADADRTTKIETNVSGAPEKVRITTNGTNRLEVENNGRIHINPEGNTAVGKLEVSTGVDPHLVLRNRDTGGGYYAIRVTDSADGIGGNKLGIFPNTTGTAVGTEAVTVDSAGNVYIRGNLSVDGTFPTAGGGGDESTMSNVGSGAQVYKEKVGSDFRLRSLLAGTNVTITQGTDTITIAASGGGGGGATATYINLGDYDAIADGSAHTVADQIGGGKPYADLAAFQVRYPSCTATTEDLNCVVIQQWLTDLSTSAGRTGWVPRGADAYVFNSPPSWMSAGPKLSNIDSLHIIFESGAIFKKSSTYTSAAQFLITFDRCDDIICENVMVHGKHAATAVGTSNGNDHGINFHSCNRGWFIGGGAWYFGGGGLTIRTKQNTSPEPSNPDWEDFTVINAHFLHCETGITTTQGGVKQMRILNCRFDDPILDSLKVSTRIQDAGRVEVAHCDFHGPGFQNTVEVQNHSDVWIHDCSFWDITTGGSVLIQSNQDAGGAADPFTEFTENWTNPIVEHNRFYNCKAPIVFNNNGQDSSTRYVVRNAIIRNNTILSVPTGATHAIRVYNGPFAEVVVTDNYIGDLPTGCKPCEINPWLSSTHHSGRYMVVFSENTIANSDQPFVTLTRDSTNSNVDWNNVWIQNNRGFTSSGTKYSYSVGDITDLVVADGTGDTEPFLIACSDETTVLTAGANKVVFRMPYSFTLSSVKASLTTASASGVVTVDINKNGVTMLSTKLTIDVNEKTSVSATTPAVISVSNIAADDEISIDLDTAGSSATGLKVTMIGVRT